MISVFIGAAAFVAVVGAVLTGHFGVGVVLAGVGLVAVWWWERDHRRR